VLLLNPDAELQPEALPRLVAALDGDARLALVGPRTLDSEAPRSLPSARR